MNLNVDFSKTLERLSIDFREGKNILSVGNKRKIVLSLDTISQQNVATSNETFNDISSTLLIANCFELMMAIAVSEMYWILNE